MVSTSSLIKIAEVEFADIVEGCSYIDHKIRISLRGGGFVDVNVSRKLAGSWACSAGYDLRILFDFCRNKFGGEDDILLIDIGSHDEVY